MTTAASKLLLAGRAHVRSRLQQRPSIVKNDVPSADGAHATREAAAVLREFADLIGVEVGHLRASDKLSDLLRVHRSAVGPDLQSLMQQVGVQEELDPFGFELLALVERRVGQNPARLQHPWFQPLPKDEDEWIQRIGAMTVTEFVAALS